MRRMAQSALAIVATLGLSGSSVAEDGHPKLDPQQGWVSLFNGKDLSGWRQAVAGERDKLVRDAWKVEGGVIARDKGKGYLWSDKQYGDFVLDLEFKVTEKTNSGVFLRYAPAPGSKPYWRDGVLEIQVFDSAAAEKPSMHDCGALYDMLAPSVNTMKKAGQWNRMTMTAKGSNITIVLNGRQIIDADLERWTEKGKNPDGTPNKYAKPVREHPRCGYIMLQDHGTPVWFRNIWIKELR